MCTIEGRTCICRNLIESLQRAKNGGDQSTVQVAS